MQSRKAPLYLLPPAQKRKLSFRQMKRASPDPRHLWKQKLKPNSSDLEVSANLCSVVTYQSLSYTPGSTLKQLTPEYYLHPFFTIALCVVCWAWLRRGLLENFWGQRLMYNFTAIPTPWQLSCRICILLTYSQTVWSISTSIMDINKATFFCTKNWTHDLALTPQVLMPRS